MSSTPIPQGKYVPAVRHGDLIITSGMTPRDNGVLIMSGKVKIADEPEHYRKAVAQAAKNALSAAKSILLPDEHIVRIISMTVYVNAEDGYTAHARFADLASDYFRETLGDHGIASRTSIGVASLPGNAPCEIQIIAEASRE